MSRDFPYRRAPIPNITEPVYDEDGFATTQMRAWMEAVEIQRGPTLDASYDLQLAVDEAVSDGTLTPNEKRDIVPQINALLNEEAGLVAEADKLSLSTTSYEAAVDAFQAILAGLTEPVAWDNLSGNTTIADADAFVSAWQAVIQAANALKRQIESFIPQAVLDTVLTPAEKRIVVPQIKALQNEESSLVTAAGNLSISTTTYEAAQDALASYLATLTSPVAWDNRSGNTDIASPSTFISRQQAVIEARDALLSAIADADVNWPRVVNVNVTETQISDNSISTPKLIANAVTADKISVNSLSALNANMGNLNVNGVLSVQPTGRIDITGTGNNFVRIGALGGGPGLGISVRDASGNFPLIIDTVAGTFAINGAVITNATLVAAKLANGEDAVIAGSGLVANFYQQGADPGAVRNGSLWFDTDTNELFIRVSSSWAKIANLSVDSGFSVSLSTSSISGSGTTGSIAANPSNGSTPYSWRWECINDSGIITNAYPTSPTSQTTTVSSGSAETGAIRCTVADANGAVRVVTGTYSVT